MFNRTLRRPMFRKGGSAGEGITSGLAPRQNFDQGKLAQVQQDLSILNQLAPRPKVPRSSSVNDFMINWGLNMAGNAPTGNIFQTAAVQAQDPFKQFQQQKTQERGMEYGAAQGQRELVAGLLKGISDDDKNKLWEEAGFWFEKGANNPFTNKPFESQDEAFNVLIQKSLMSKESLKTDDALFLETKEDFRNRHLQDKTLNPITADVVATHEAKVVHKMYPKRLLDELDIGQSYIDSIFIDVDANGNMTLNNIGKNVGYVPNKIYFNITDQGFYRLGEDGRTFTVVDITDFQD